MKNIKITALVVAALVFTPVSIVLADIAPEAASAATTGAAPAGQGEQMKSKRDEIMQKRAQIKKLHEENQQNRAELKKMHEQVKQEKLSKMKSMETQQPAVQQ